MRETIDRYLIAARQAGLSAATLRQYGWNLRKMATWLSERGIERAGDVSRDTIREWGASLWDGWSAATIRQAMNAARSFFRFCAAEGFAEDVGRALVVPNVPSKVQRTITAAEVMALLKGCDDTTVKGIRDAALITLLVDTALRASEICRIETDMVRLETGLLVVTIKGGKEEPVFFGQTTAARLRAWLAVRKPADGVTTLFVSLGGITPGHPLTPRGLRSILKRLGEEVGIKGVTTHAFRRSFAVIATIAGAPTRVVQLAGRWSSMQMVELYTQSLGRQEMYRQGWNPIDYLENNDK